jgi:hypothetical protein
MLALLSKAWEWILWTVTQLQPFKADRAIAPALLWVVWIFLDLAVLVVLYIVNDHFEFTGAVRLPRVLASALWLRQFYLPIVGQLLILTGVVLYWLYLLWFAPVDASAYPDIDEAWQEGLRALAYAGIQPGQVPLFLVLGRPAGTEDQLFEAAGLKLVVAPTPANPRAPVRLCADREGVYVTCRGASVLGKLAAVLALDDVAQGATAELAESADALDKTHDASGKEQDLLDLLRTSAGQQGSPRIQRALRRAALGRALGHDLLADASEIAHCQARLTHLCRLIIRDRAPYCAANGILLVLPFAGTETPAEAQLTAQAVQEDLAIARQGLKLDCPLVVLLADMEQVAGFTEFIQRQPQRELGNRRGCGFPMMTRLPSAKVVEQVVQSVAWICSTYMPDSIYRLFGTETAAKPDGEASLAGNARLVLLLDELHSLVEPLSSIVEQAMAPPHEDLLRYSGCYLAATGARDSQAFVAGVFQKMLKEQNCVSWTSHAVAEDAHNRTWANYYAVAASLLAVVWVLVLAYIVTRA